MIRSVIFSFLLLALGVTASAQKTKPKTPTAVSGSIFEMTIVHNGEKTDVKSTQFQSADGNAVASDRGRETLFFGASNSKDDKNFTFSGWLPVGKTGNFTIGDGPEAGFSVMTSLFSNVPLFQPERGGTISVTSNPTSGGFVVGTFQGVCKSVTEAGTIEDYTISGSFKLARN